MRGWGGSHRKFWSVWPEEKSESSRYTFDRYERKLILGSKTKYITSRLWNRDKIPSNRSSRRGQSDMIGFSVFKIYFLFDCLNANLTFRVGKGFFLLVVPLGAERFSTLLLVTGTGASASSFSSSSAFSLSLVIRSKLLESIDVSYKRDLV